VDKLTAIVKNPENAEKKETFEETLIASTTTRDLDKIKTVNALETEWAQDSAAYTKLPFTSKTQRNFQKGLTSIRRGFAPNTDEILPNHINWVPRRTNLPTVTPERTRILDQSNILTMVVPANITSTQKSTRNEPPQYTIQVGAYKTEANAKQVVSNLFKKGYRAHINHDVKDSAPLFKVHIDKFSDKNEARKLAEKLTIKENLPSFVTTTRIN
jgi:cell division septation protein DedD